MIIPAAHRAGYVRELERALGRCEGDESRAQTEYEEGWRDAWLATMSKPYADHGACLAAIVAGPPPRDRRWKRAS